MRPAPDQLDRLAGDERHRARQLASTDLWPELAANPWKSAPMVRDDEPARRTAVSLLDGSVIVPILACQTARRYLLTQSGTKIARITAIAISALTTSSPAGSPRHRARHGVDDDRHRVDLVVGLQPSRHRLDRHEGGRGEHEDGQDRERRRLRRLGVAHARGPTRAKTHDIAKPNAQQQQDRDAERGPAAVDLEADEEPDDRPSAITTPMLRTRSAIVRPASTAERAIGSERKRSISPLARSSRQADAGVHRTERDGLHEDPRHQEVDVLDPRRC